jgi:hypothetical protein
MRDITKSDPHQKSILFSFVTISVADPHHVDASPGPDPDPACHFDADPDPACHFYADPDPSDTSFQIKAQSAQIGSHSKHLGMSSAN